MGTGDCFAVKFFSEHVPVLKIMIDAGTWSGSKKKLTPFIKDLMEYLDYHPDILVVTHEHKDHVHAFDACRELFTNKKFKVDELWLGWTEKDESKRVEDWKKEYGQKKKALGAMAKKVDDAIKSPEFRKQYSTSADGTRRLAARYSFSRVLSGFAELHLTKDAKKDYIGGQKGMEVVKKDITRRETRYCKPGEIVSNLKNISELKFYILGPPELYKDISKETGGKGESYEHNRILGRDSAFSAAIMNQTDQGTSEDIMPFDLSAVNTSAGDTIKKQYDSEPWRKIDFDWLFSAGSFALRMNGLTNNLSLAIAIEVGNKVLLFPGDAEFGSWASWHNLKWPERDQSSEAATAKHLTEDLLNRTVFYKVAHHLSHNGTAKRLGLELMKHPGLAAMATLDYDTINDGWTRTMPNRAIIDELLVKTKGRLMIMSEKGLFYDSNEEVPLTSKINETRSRMSANDRATFDADFKTTDLFLQYTVRF